MGLRLIRGGMRRFLGYNNGALILARKGKDANRGKVVYMWISANPTKAGPILKSVIVRAIT